jgi:glutamate/aspartate transport system permease protein
MRNLDWSAVIHALPFLWQGLLTTFLLVGLAMVGGILLGTLLAVLRLSAPRPVAAVAAGYVNGLRSIPLIMVIFWFYLLVPLFIGRPVGAFTSALIAFTLFEAAYYSEIMRAGIQAISNGQMGAALAMGMSPTQAYRYVILPQALRRMAPVLLTQSVALFQDTSLVYVIGLHDFMTSVGIVAEREARLIELYLFAAFVYFIICYSASRVVKRLQDRRAVGW